MRAVGASLRMDAMGRNRSKAAPNHSNRVTFDEQAMVTGMAVYTAVAMGHLAG